MLKKNACPMSQLELREILDYDSDTGLFFWKCRRGGKATTGIEAGCLNSVTGYITIRMVGRPVYAHKLAWFWWYGEWPDEIDHKNRNSMDNRIDNLRPVTRQQNCANRSINKRAERKGVSWDGRECKWRARITVSGKTIYLGRFLRVDDACSAYDAAATRYFGAYAAPNGAVA
jgi:hypothetical protein